MAGSLQSHVHTEPITVAGAECAVVCSVLELRVESLQLSLKASAGILPKENIRKLQARLTEAH